MRFISSLRFTTICLNVENSYTYGRYHFWYRETSQWQLLVVRLFINCRSVIFKVAFAYLWCGRSPKNHWPFAYFCCGRSLKNHWPFASLCCGRSPKNDCPFARWSSGRSSGRSRQKFDSRGERPLSGRSFGPDSISYVTYEMLLYLENGPYDMVPRSIKEVANVSQF